MDAFEQWRANDAWIAEQQRIGAKRKVREAHNRTMADVLNMLASSMMPTVLLHPDPTEAARAFTRSQKYMMVASLIGSGLVPDEKMGLVQDFLEDDDGRG